MNPSSSSGNEPERVAPFPGRSRLSAPVYKFSPDEMRVMRECNKESFYKRCIPMGTALGVATYVGVNTGYLKRSLRYGATPKVVVAVIVGYFLGKFSYQHKCAEKLMQLPNSQLGEMLRQKRKGFLQESLDPGFGSGMSLAPFSNPTDQYSDVGPSNSLDIDTTRPEYEGLDDNFRPTVDNPIYEEDMPPVQKHTTSYEELRKKNREEYQHQKIGLYRAADSRSSAQLPPPNAQKAEEQPSTRGTNKYGDVLM